MLARSRSKWEGDLLRMERIYALRAPRLFLLGFELRQALPGTHRGHVCLCGTREVRLRAKKPTATLSGPLSWGD